MSKLQVDEIVNKEDTSSVAFPRGAVVTGVATATTFDGNVTGNVTGDVTGTASEATEAIAAKSGSALETSINGKTSPGKAIALSMVFG
tara:strand:+ start:1049 stop:1312 length:264 start_codon:yes stop_codon:yes gene_type:complete